MEHDIPPRRETPRSEPEIIPPGASGPRTRPQPRILFSVTDGEGRPFVKPPGPFTIAAILVGAILVAALILLLVLGALLVWVPIIAIALAGAVLIGFLRGKFRWPR